jgi:hypothetical protein
MYVYMYIRIYMYMTTALASRLTPARMMHAIGQLEIWCGMFMLISLAGKI